MAKKPRNIETPGASAPPSADNPPAENAPAAAPAATPATAPVLPADTSPALANSAGADALKNAESERRVRETQHLVGSPEALDWGHLSNPARLLAVVGANAPDKDPEAHLPRVDQVDWSKVPKGEDKILTKSGWLLRP
jgi:hypothetical protein